MKSVVFEDYTKRTSEVKKTRKELLDLLNNFKDWEQCETLELTKKIYPEWKKETSLLYEIQKIGEKIGDPTMDHSRPIKSIDEITFSVKEYKVLRALGYSEKAIADAMGKSKAQFDRYKANYFIKASERRVKQ